MKKKKTTKKKQPVEFLLLVKVNYANDPIQGKIKRIKYINKQVNRATFQVQTNIIKDAMMRYK